MEKKETMLIREPLVHATYYYLHEAPGDSPARRQDRHAAFVEDVQRIQNALTGWLSMSAPVSLSIAPWDAEGPSTAQPLMKAAELHGQINASAWLQAFVLRNMLLLRVIVLRPGEHEQSAWSLLDEALGAEPTAPSWLQTVRYWCGMAPRPPEDLEQERSLPVKTPFGVLCLGRGGTAHLLVYPDQRTESRASNFLRSLAPQLDWYPVQARYRLEQYTNHAAVAVRNQQQALEQVTQSVQYWSAPRERSRLRSLLPLQADLDLLETTYGNVLSDLATTRAAAQEVQMLMTDYRLSLMQSGLWDAAPSVWEAQVSSLAELQAQIAHDEQHIDVTLRRLDVMMRTLQTRLALMQSERERTLVYLVGVLGLAILAVLVTDASLSQMALHLLALIVVMGLVFAAWQFWLRRRMP